MPDGSVAYVSGIESKAVIDSTSLSGAMSQDRLPLAPRIQARGSQGAEIRELAGRVGLRGHSTGPRLFFARVWDDRRGPAPHVSRHELKGDGGLAYG